MSTPGRKNEQRPAPARRAAVIEAEPEAREAPGEHLCTCCEPRSPLVMRPDLGILGDGSAEFALCVLHEPDPVVYRNRGDGVYLRASRLALNPAGEIVDEAGEVVARVPGDAFQRLTTIDDDDAPPGGGEGAAEADGEPGWRPATEHVDLSQDDFYAGDPPRTPGRSAPRRRLP